MIHRRVPRSVLALVAAGLIAAAATSSAAPRLAEVRGHLLLGYAKLFDTGAPGGSLSIGAGLDHPVGPGLRAGVDIGYHLLGSRTLEQGTLTTGLDYSLFEALAQIHWAPRGPRVTLSAGPGLFIAHADLGSSPIGAGFAKNSIAQTHAGAALGVTLARGGTAPVRVGAQAALRVVPLDGTTWTIVTGRIALFY